MTRGNPYRYQQHNPSLAWGIGTVGGRPSRQTETPSSQPETRRQTSRTFGGRGLPGSPPPNLDYLSHWFHLHLTGDATFRGSQRVSKNPTDSSFLLQGAPIPSLPSLYTAGAFMLLKSSFPFVRAASTPTPFSCRPPSCSKPLCPPQTGTLCSNSGSWELVAWRAPTWEPAGEAATLCLPRPPPPALSPASRSLQLALCTPTFLEEGNRDGSRQQRSRKGVVGRKGVLLEVRTLQVPAAEVKSRRSSGTGLPWLAGRAPSKHGARVRSGRDGLGRAGV